VCVVKNIEAEWHNKRTVVHSGYHDGKMVTGGYFLVGADYSRRKYSLIMSRKLRSRKEEEDGVEQVFDRMVKGMRNEINTVIWRIERSRDVSPEALRNMVKNGLDAMVGAVEKAMNGISDGLAKERKEQEQKEEDNKWRLVRENETREERRRKQEERVRKLVEAESYG
jgi:hypothetical protein